MQLYLNCLSGNVGKLSFVAINLKIFIMIDNYANYNM